MLVDVAWRWLNQLQHVGTCRPSALTWGVLQVATKATAAVPVTSHTHIPKIKQDPYRTPPKNYVQLLQHITRANHVNVLEQLVRQYGTRFDAVHVAAALVMLPKLYEPPSARTQLTSQQLKRRRARPAELLKQLQQQADAQVPRMFVREVAAVTWALGRCRALLPEGNAHNTTTTGLVRKMMDHINKDNGRLLYQGVSGAEVAQLLHGLARLKLGSISHSNLQHLCRIVIKQPQRLQIKEVAAAAWALAKINPAAGHSSRQVAAAVEALSQQAVVQRLFLRPVSMTSLLTACVHLKHKDKELLAAICEEALHQIRDFKPLQLSLLVWSMGQLEHPLPPELASAVTAASRRHLEQFDALQLGLLLKGFRQLKQLDKQLLADVAAGISREQQVVVRVRDVIRILAAFVAEPHAGLLKDVEGMAARFGDALKGSPCMNASARQVTDLLVCYSKLPAQHQLLLDLLEDVTVRPEAFTLRQWEAMLRAAERLGYANPDLNSSCLAAFYASADEQLQKHLLGASATSGVKMNKSSKAASRAQKGWFEKLKDAFADDQQQQQQQQHQVVTPGEEEAAAGGSAADSQEQARQCVQLSTAVDVARLLGVRRGLSRQSAGLLAAEGLKRLPALKARQTMLLLIAAVSGDRLVREEEVRQLLQQAAAKLQQLNLADQPACVLVAATHALAHAMSRNVLLTSGEPLLHQLYQALLPKLEECDQEQVVLVVKAMQLSAVTDIELQERVKDMAAARKWTLPSPNNDWGPLGI